VRSKTDDMASLV